MDLRDRPHRLGEVTALVGGQEAGAMHTYCPHPLAGTVNIWGSQGGSNINDVHRWDLMPGNGQGWPLDLSGRLDLIRPAVRAALGHPGNATSASVHFRRNGFIVAAALGGVAQLESFPGKPIMELARQHGRAASAETADERRDGCALGFLGPGPCREG